MLVSPFVAEIEAVYPDIEALYTDPHQGLSAPRTRADLCCESRNGQ